MRDRLLDVLPDDPVEALNILREAAGLEPWPMPTKENPERWDCDCGGLWRILTVEQISRKFAHLKHAVRGAENRSVNER